jgi:hypothetical protein
MGGISSYETLSDHSEKKGTYITLIEPDPRDLTEENLEKSKKRSKKESHSKVAIIYRKYMNNTDAIN